jgi:hypothetical protein
MFFRLPAGPVVRGPDYETEIIGSNPGSGRGYCDEQLHFFPITQVRKVILNLE